MYRSSCYTKQMGYSLTPIPTLSRLSSSCASYTKPAPPLQSFYPPPSPTSPARPTLTASISSSYTRPHFHPLMAFSPDSSSICLLPRFPPPPSPLFISLHLPLTLLLFIPPSPAAATGSWWRGHADALRGGGVETWTAKLHTQRCPIMRLSGAAPRSTAASVVVGFWS